MHALLNKYKKDIKKLYFATCCGSSDVKKDAKFGYARVFLQVKSMIGEKCIDCEAFPVDLALSEDKKDLGDAIMNTRYSDATYNSDIQKRLEDFTQKVIES